MNHQALMALLVQSLRQGHWRVACRRYLKLVAAHAPVPAARRRQCEALLRRCSPGELKRMRQDAGAWAGLVFDRTTGGCESARISDGQACAGPSYATQWRPYPVVFRSGPGLLRGRAVVHEEPPR